MASPAPSTAGSSTPIESHGDSWGKYTSCEYALCGSYATLSYRYYTGIAWYSYKREENDNADAYTIAAVGKSSTPANGNISIAPNAAKKNIKKKFAYYNKDEQRLDEPLPLKDPAGAHALEARMKKLGKNMCNNWYVVSCCELAGAS